MYKFKSHFPKIVCADGFFMSVQASKSHYCTPRQDDGPYTHAEVGFPSEYTPEFVEYAEGDPESMSDSVCGFVPVTVINAVIARHGGIDLTTML